MKFIWQVSDFTGRDNGFGGASGVVIHRPHGKKERCIIGYDPADRGDSHWRIISMQDGMISYHSKTVEEFVETMNKNGFVPVFNPVSADEAVMVGPSQRLRPEEAS